ncbi:hypothetical protein BDV26DRAFT_278670 [Aspergillus bertholletiae]|uniref:Uncharacterized protein n=1 Tax=Aspergillus bertholletiae TaxID=1226010 RepID=A0A5N7BIT3_9EURO|nr:hypothetical protein BDV26DRAFT_278670 [Aspergillus bertholletiae]
MDESSVLQPDVRIPGSGAQDWGSDRLVWGSLSPPQMNSILADTGQLQPGIQQLEIALYTSRKHWSCVAIVAVHYPEKGIQAKSANPHHVLGKDPFGASPGPILCFQASVTWALHEPTVCDSVQKNRTDAIPLHLGTKSTVPSTFDGTAFSDWIGTEEEVAVGPNYLAILTLRWRYILSAHLIEMQGQGAMMKYTELTTMDDHNSGIEASTCTIDIGEASDDVISWWSAILSPGEGWRAVVKQCPSGAYVAPWSFLVAFTTALTVPTHNLHGSTLQLPRPAHTSGRSAPTEVIISSLCAMFWGPAVLCYLAPEKESISTTPERYADMLSIICGIRRPTISALWLRAAAGGLALIILRRVMRGRPPLDPVAFLWTGCPQTFMDDDGLSYRYRPRTPWEPCGKMHIGEIVLSESNPLEQDASREASLDIFRWFVMSGEGFPPEDIYQDEWLEELQDTERKGGRLDM